MAKTPVIAIVDDDEGVRTSLASLVRSLGYEARTYGSGGDFLHEPPGEDPACMIADIQMPVMTGDELQARLLAAGRRFPIIFMTAFPTEPIRQRVMGTADAAEGINSFLERREPAWSMSAVGDFPDWPA